MERPGQHHSNNHVLFFNVIGAGDELIRDLKRITIRLSMRLNTSLEYLQNMPLLQVIDLLHEVVEMDEEDRAAREKARRGR